MAQITIEYTQDTSDCECCGMSWAEGANVTIDNETFSLVPTASCFGGDHWDRGDVLVEVLKRLGHEVAENY